MCRLRRSSLVADSFGVRDGFFMVFDYLLLGRFKLYWLVTMIPFARF